MTERDSFPVYPGWETVRKIGNGSFGTVYEIRRNLFGVIEQAALKHISIPQNQSDAEELYCSGYDDASVKAHYESYLADIVREYQLMAEMKGHTNVVYCDDIRFAEKKDGVGWDVYIKMELLTSLMKALDQVSEERQIIRLGKDMAAALTLCRSRNIVHRDIKPQNIFLSKDGDFKLGDFGIAKTVEKTAGGTKIGTYSYMAPEVYNNEPYGHEADIYSLGVVLYWLLNDCRLPFFPAPPAVPKASDIDQARLRRFRGDPLPPPAHGSEELQRIVRKACAFDPKERYRSAEEMLRDLKKLESPNFSEATKLERTEADEKAERKQTDEERQEKTGSEIDSTIGLFDQKESKRKEVSKSIDESDATVGVFNKKETPVKQEPEPRPPKSPKGRVMAACVIAAIALALGLCIHSGILKPRYEGLRYALDGTSLTLSGKGPVESLEDLIPDWDNIKTDIRSVTIKSGVTGIGNSAFRGCGSLAGVTIPDGVTSIGETAFSGCGSLTSITIPDGVTNIGNAAFSGCGLTSVTIPNSVTSIGDSAFYWCSSLASVTIPDGVTSIGRKAFLSCSSLLSVTIPDSVTSIGDSAFYECSSLKSVTIPDSVRSIGNNVFCGCSSLTSVTIPDGVTSIGNSAFYSCRSLLSVTLPDSVTSIGDFAFEGCGLTSVTIPNSVTSIGHYVFYGCSSLTSMTIPDSVTSIGNYAFSWCRSLSSVTLPDSVKSIDHNAFSECDSLRDVYYGGSEEQWKQVDIGDGNDDLTNANIHCNAK